MNNNDQQQTQSQSQSQSQTINLLLVLIGLPACGKTLFSKSLIEYLYINKISLINNSLINQNINIYHIEFDNLFKLICESLNIDNNNNNNNNNNNLQNWKPTRLEAYNQTLNIVNNNHNQIKLLNPISPNKSYKIINSNIINNSYIINLIILDDNMYYKSMRYKYYQISNFNNSVKYCQIFFKKDLSKSIENNNNRIKLNNNDDDNNNNVNLNSSHNVNNEIIEKMNNNIEPPNINKNKWEKDNTLFIDYFNLDEMDEIVYNLINKYKEFTNTKYDDNDEMKDDGGSELLKENERRITRNNIIHQFDLQCRKIISDIMKSKIKSSVSTPYSNISKLLSQQKQSFLKTTLSNFIQDNSDYIVDYSDIIPYSDQLLNNFKNKCLDLI